MICNECFSKINWMRSETSILMQGKVWQRKYVDTQVSTPLLIYPSVQPCNLALKWLYEVYVFKVAFILARFIIQMAFLLPWNATAYRVKYSIVNAANKYAYFWWEPWSSGYRRRLTFWRSWVRIPACILDRHFFIFFAVKIVMFVWKDEIKNEKESGDGPY